MCETAERSFAGDGAFAVSKTELGTASRSRRNVGYR